MVAGSSKETKNYYSDLYKTVGKNNSIKFEIINENSIKLIEEIRDIDENNKREYLNIDIKFALRKIVNSDIFKSKIKKTIWWLYL